MLSINLNREPEKPLSVDNTYTFMQGSQLDHLSSLIWTQKHDEDGKLIFDHVEGSFKAHCEHHAYMQLLANLTDLEDKSVLDYGCGKGRNILAFHDKVRHITGIDICQRVIEQANTYINNHSDAANFTLLKNNGIDLKFIPDNSYDVVISSRCLSGIAVYSIRYNLLKEFCRILKPGGWLSFQMSYGLGNDKQYQLPYYKNFWRASGLKYSCCVKSIEEIEDDLTTFIDFHHFSFKIVEAPPDEICKDTRWIFVKAQKKG